MYRIVPSWLTRCYEQICVFTEGPVDAVQSEGNGRSEQVVIDKLSAGVCVTIVCSYVQ